MRPWGGGSFGSFVSGAAAVGSESEAVPETASAASGDGAVEVVASVFSGVASVDATPTSVLNSTHPSGVAAPTVPVVEQSPAISKSRVSRLGRGVWCMS